MKKLILILSIMLTTITYSQNIVEPSIIEPEVEKTETIQEMVVKYGSELIETVKTGGKFIMNEVSEIIVDYLIYNSIYHGLKVLFGLFLIFYISKKVLSLFTITKEEYESHNSEIENNDTALWAKADLYYEILKHHFKSINAIVFGLSSYFILIISGLILVANNLFIFIKITLFPKLYLTELIIDLLK